MSLQATMALALLIIITIIMIKQFSNHEKAREECNHQRTKTQGQLRSRTVGKILQEFRQVYLCHSVTALSALR